MLAEGLVFFYSWWSIDVFFRYYVVYGLVSCSLPVVLVRDCDTTCSLAYIVLSVSFWLVSGFYFPETLTPISYLSQSMIQQSFVLSIVCVSFAWVALAPRYPNNKPNDYESGCNIANALPFWTTDSCCVFTFRFHTLVSLEFCWHGFPISSVRQSRYQGILNV